MIKLAIIVAVILFMGGGSLVQAYKTVDTCIEDPLFSSCFNSRLVTATIGCSQITQDGGGTDLDFCTDAVGGGGGGGSSPWYIFGTGLYINHSVTAAISVDLNDTNSYINASNGYFDSVNVTENVTAQWCDAKVPCYNVEGEDVCFDADVHNLTDQSVNTTSNVTHNLLNITGANTGDVLSGDVDIHVGKDFGAIEIGDVQILQSDLTVAGMNINGTYIVRNTNSNSPIQFAFVTDDNLIRLAIPRAGFNLGTYNPRSFMIGGDLGQSFNNLIANCSSQGYDNIDCDTTATGADLGIQDDLEVRGSVWINESLNISTGRLIVPGLASCDTINTTPNGTFICGEDADSGGVDTLKEGAAPYLYNDSTSIFWNETTGNQTYYTQWNANSTFVYQNQVNLTHYTQEHANATFSITNTIPWVQHDGFFEPNSTGNVNVSTGTFIVPGLASCDTINTTPNGTFICGEDDNTHIVSLLENGGQFWLNDSALGLGRANSRLNISSAKQQALYIEQLNSGTKIAEFCDTGACVMFKKFAGTPGLFYTKPGGGAQQGYFATEDLASYVFLANNGPGYIEHYGYMRSKTDFLFQDDRTINFSSSDRSGVYFKGTDSFWNEEEMVISPGNLTVTDNITAEDAIYGECIESEYTMTITDNNAVASGGFWITHGGVDMTATHGITIVMDSYIIGGWLRNSDTLACITPPIVEIRDWNSYAFHIETSHGSAGTWSNYSFDPIEIDEGQFINVYTRIYGCTTDLNDPILVLRMKRRCD